MFVPERVSVPLPVLVTAPPEPLMPPLKLVLVLSPPAVSVLAPSVTEPAPASDPMVSDAAIFRVAPEATVTAFASTIAVPLFKLRMPADTVVRPVKVLVPDKVMVPLPCLVKAPVPEITPATVVLVLSPPVVRVKVPKSRLAVAAVLLRLPTA